MKVKFNKPRGQRVKKSYPRPLWIEPVNTDMIFDTTEKRWVKNYTKGNGVTTAYYSMRYHGLRDVYSVKAAIRLIKSWDVPTGSKWHVSLPWVGHDFIITKL